VGGWPGEFRFVHEGVDLAWRAIDAGYRVHYAADLAALHPLPVPGAARHGYSLYYGARNRVWLARRYLPWPLGALFVGSFALRTLPRLRSLEELRSAVRGYVDGMRGPFGARRRLRPRTLWRMTRAGRPPVV
jgi:GT2 family glycosyltransferase